ncbi:MAG: hypothetical protein BWY02_01285 [bacterium ADurb.Bin157]|nr:MAG: hypothetical protein BWY02_01285 [bacterium ADurb.Bin157]
MIKDERHFQEIMLGVDEEMIREQIPVFRRTLVAFRKVSEKLNIDFPLGGFGFTNTSPRVGIYSGHDLSLRIQKWVSEKYGDKLKFDFDLGAIAVEITGAVYKLRLPMVYGKIGVFLDHKSVGKTSASGGLNLFSMIVDLTPGLAAQLPNAECEKLLSLFLLGMNVFNSMRANESEFLSIAQSDFRTATSHLLHQPPELGLAKWAILQAVEKIIKDYIMRHGGNFNKQKGHNLAYLADIAEQQGLPALDKADLAKIQCDAGIRYREPQIPVSEVLLAQNTALKISLRVLNFT